MASVARRPDGRWRARYRDESGLEHARHFDRKVDAQRWLDEVTASVVTGMYVDPRAGRLTVREYAERWRAMQSHRPTTRAHVETMLRRHVYPTMGDRALSSVVPSHVQELVRRLSTQELAPESGKVVRAALAPATVAVVHSILAGVFGAAVRDRRIPANPCDGTRLPKVERRRVEPLMTENVQALADAVPDRYRALVVLAAGTGLRQGEALGLTLDRVDFLRRTLRVDRQLVLLPRAVPTFGPPKTAASVRDVPLPQVVVDALAVHLAAYPTGPNGLIFTDDAGQPIRRTRFSTWWRRAVTAAAAPQGSTFHDLRHYYASLLIRHGESVKVVQARLGHASAAETLDTYSHLWPDSDDRTREAVDEVLGQRGADSLRTAGGS